MISRPVRRPVRHAGPWPPALAPHRASVRGGDPAARRKLASARYSIARLRAPRFGAPSSRGEYQLSRYPSVTRLKTPVVIRATRTRRRNSPRNSHSCQFPASRCVPLAQAATARHAERREPKSSVNTRHVVEDSRVRCRVGTGTSVSGASSRWPVRRPPRIVKMLKGSGRERRHATAFSIHRFEPCCCFSARVLRIYWLPHACRLQQPVPSPAAHVGI